MQSPEISFANLQVHLRRGENQTKEAHIEGEYRDSQVTESQQIGDKGDEAEEDEGDAVNQHENAHDTRAFQRGRRRDGRGRGSGIADVHFLFSIYRCLNKNKQYIYSFFFIYIYIYVYISRAC